MKNEFDKCTSCGHIRYAHVMSENWNDEDWWWQYEECTEDGCDCEQFKD